jgi:two-component system, OmpR family, alkaline phosphatase synthesis response regulator PhoP
MAKSGSSRPRVLIVEDEADVLELIRYNLEQEGIDVEEARDGRNALRQIEKNAPDLVVLDLMLPEISGFEICRKVRASDYTRTLPIIIVTARSSEADKVLGLELGADDYVTKPFSPRELTARVKAVLRRSADGNEAFEAKTYERGRLRIDFAAYQVLVDGEPRDLPLREFELLAFLVKHPMRVFTREQLLDLVWGPGSDSEARTIDVHIHRLRAQLEQDEINPRLIVTVRGVGYRFDPDG